ncbi:MAG: hypothetical protein C4K48_10560 [Candidatus Thorarchaeota archaeon]|nr:MAG: hypothetical protein C4K48_10560 [Candidatus Thorarchaeota archaeon]
MVHNLGKADWTDRDRIQGIIDSYSLRYGESFWAALIGLIGEQRRESIADFGCGPGLFLVDAAHRFSARRLFGLDESKEMLEQAKTFIRARTAIKSYELTVINFDAATIPIRPKSIDLAFCGFMLHEVASPQGFVDQVSGTLRTGGVCAVHDFVSRDEETFVRKMTEQGMAPERARLRFPHMCKHSLDDIRMFMEAAGLQDVQSSAVNDIRGLAVGLMK